MEFFNTEKEQEALLKFREKIKELAKEMTEEQLKDYNLLRWLRARELNLEKAEEMLRAHLKWRKDNDVDNIMSWRPPDEFLKAVPYKISGVDKDGCHIFVCPSGLWDIRDLCERGYKDVVRRSTIQFLEMISEFTRVASKENGKLITQYIMINDMEGYSMRQMLSSDVRESNIEMMKIFEGQYPELLKKSVVVNEKWKAALLDGVDPDNLPSYYGGSNLTCPDYHIDYAYKLYPIAPEYSADLFKIVTVNAGTAFDVDIDVDAPGATLSWNFRTEAYDIGFQFTFGDTVLFSCQRVDSHKVTQKGYHVCKESGKYTLTFDNKHSKMRAKMLSYYLTKDSNNNDTPNGE